MKQDEPMRHLCFEMSSTKNSGHERIYRGAIIRAHSNSARTHGRIQKQGQEYISVSKTLCVLGR